MQLKLLFPLTLAPSRRERIPRPNLRFATLNLVGTCSTASLTSGNYGDAVERVPTITRRFMGRELLSSGLDNSLKGEHSPARPKALPLPGGEGRDEGEGGLLTNRRR